MLLFFPNFNLKIVKIVTFHCISSKLMTSDVQCDKGDYVVYLPLNSQACSRCFNVVLTTTLQALFSTWVLIKVVFFLIIQKQKRKKVNS